MYDQKRLFAASRPPSPAGLVTAPRPLSRAATNDVPQHPQLMGRSPSPRSPSRGRDRRDRRGGYYDDRDRDRE